MLSLSLEKGSSVCLAENPCALEIKLKQVCFLFADGSARW